LQDTLYHIFIYCKRKKRESATPAKKWESAARGASAGSVCDEFVALATDEEQNEPDEAPQPAGSRFLAGVAERESSGAECLIN